MKKFIFLFIILISLNIISWATTVNFQLNKNDATSIVGIPIEDTVGTGVAQYWGLLLNVGTDSLVWFDISSFISGGGDVPLDSVFQYFNINYFDTSAALIVCTFSDSTGKIDTTYTPFQTYVANHGGSGLTLAGVFDLFQTVYVDTLNDSIVIRFADLSDSTSKIDTTYTPFQTYVANHGGSGVTLADIFNLFDKNYADTLNDSIIIIFTDSAGTIDTSYVPLRNLIEGIVNDSIAAVRSDINDSLVAIRDTIQWICFGTCDTLIHVSGTDTLFIRLIDGIWTWGSDGLTIVDTLQINNYVRWINGVSDSTVVDWALIDSMVTQKGRFAPGGVGSIDSTRIEYGLINHSDPTQDSIVAPEDTIRVDSIVLVTQDRLVDSLLGKLDESDPNVDSANWNIAYDSITAWDNGILLWADGSVVANFLEFAPQTSLAYGEGRLFYDDPNKTFAIYSDINGVTLQIGQEFWIRVRNNSGGTLLDGSPVYITGSSGNLPTAEYADAEFDSTSHVAAVITYDILNNNTGFMTSAGVVRELNTSSFSTDSLLYLDTIAGGLTHTPPNGNFALVEVAHVLNVHATEGEILIHIDEHSKLGALADVDTDGVSGGSIIAYNGSYWVDSTIEALGFFDTAQVVDTIMALNIIQDGNIASIYETRTNVALIGDDTTAFHSAVTHINSDGSDHSFIDQDVTIGSSPTFDATNITGVVSGSVDQTHINIRAGTSTIPSGTPVYSTSYNVSGFYIVEPSDASDGSTMPALCVTSVATTTTGTVLGTTNGSLSGLTTDTILLGAIDSALYVAEGGGLTITKPTGSNLIQKMAIFGHSHSSQGVIQVVGAGRTNDVPNFAEGPEYIWAGGTDSVAIEIDLDSVVAVKLEDSLNSYSTTSEAEALYQPIGHGDADSLRGAYINTDPSTSQDQQIPRYFATGDSVGWTDDETSPVLNNIIVTGDFGVLGNFYNSNFSNEFYLESVYARHANDKIVIPANHPNFTVDDSAEFLDSSNATHPTVLYTPKGFYGNESKKKLMAFTPFATSDSFEDPFLVWSDAGTNEWTPIIFGTDTLSNPVFDTSDFPGSKHIADVEIWWDDQERLWLLFRVTFDSTGTVADSNIVVVSRFDTTAGGVPTMTTPVTINNVAGANSTLSPSMILDTNSTYTRWDVEPIDSSGIALTKIVRYVCSSTDSIDITTGWNFKDTTEITPPHDSLKIWHMEVVAKGADVLLILATCTDTATASGDSANLYVGVSYDRGFSVVWSTDSPVLPVLGTARTASDSLKLWSRNVYRSSGYWVDDGSKGYLNLYYSALALSGSPSVGWHILNTKLRFDGQATKIDLTFDYLPGLPAFDSTELSFNEVLNGVPITARDSAISASSYTANDTLYFTWDDLPKDLLSVDALIIESIISDTAQTNIKNIELRGKSSGGFKADSTYEDILTGTLARSIWVADTVVINSRDFREKDQLVIKVTTAVDGGENIYFGRVYLICTIKP